MEYERETWSHLAALATHSPDSGVCFGTAYMYRRDRDAGSTTGVWNEQLMKDDAWFQSTVPEVSFASNCLSLRV